MDVIVSRYYQSEKLFGAEKFAKRFYEHFIIDNKATFIDFYRGYSPLKVWKKIFSAKILIKNNHIEFVKMGVFPILLFLYKYRPQKIILTSLEGYSLFFIIYKIVNKKCSVYNIVHGIYKYELKYDIEQKINWITKIKIQFVEKIIFKYSDIIYFPSELARTNALNYYDLSKKELRIQYHGVDKVFGDQKKNVNLTDSLNLVYVGGYGRKFKGLQFLIEALQTIEFNLNLAICGQISDHKKLAENLELLPNNVTCSVYGLVTTQDLVDLYKCSDIFVMPSKFETFGVAALEAMFSGLVAIVTKNCGIKEIIKNEINGFTVEYGNIPELVELLSTLNSNRNIISKVSRNAHDTAGNYIWEKVLRNYFLG